MLLVSCRPGLPGCWVNVSVAGAPGVIWNWLLVAVAGLPSLSVTPAVSVYVPTRGRLRSLNVAVAVPSPLSTAVCVVVPPRTCMPPPESVLRVRATACTADWPGLRLVTTTVTGGVIVC